MSFKDKRDNDTLIRGIKIFPEYSRCTDAETCAHSIHDAGFNTVFMPVRGKDLSDKAEFDLHAFRLELQQLDIRFSAVVQIFFDPEQWDEHPEWRALDQNKIDAPESWQTMLSPACRDFRNLKLEHIRRIIQELNPDMLALDFIRYPVFWENVHVDSLHKITRYYDYNQLSINELHDIHNVDFSSNLMLHQHHSQEWISFKTGQITSFVRDVRTLIGDIPLILHILPWLERDQEFYLKSLAGQDVDSLAKYSDILSPMLYTMVPGLAPERIRKMLSDFTDRHTGIPLLPSYLIPENSIESLSGFDLSGGYLLFHWGLAEKQRKSVRE